LARTSHACRRVSPEPVPDDSEMRIHPVLFRKVGTAPFGQRSLALRHGSCLLPLKLPFHLRRTTSFSMPPAPFGSYRVSVVIAGLLIPAPSMRIAQSATARLPFLPPVATPAGYSGCSCSFSTAGWRTTTLAHSSNFRLSPTVFAPCSETRNEERDLACGRFPRPAPLVSSRHGSMPLTS